MSTQHPTAPPQEGVDDQRGRHQIAEPLGTPKPINFYSIDYVDTVAEYFDPDPNLMHGDGLRQRWPPGALEKIRQVQVRR
jgi:hypothetical protein